MEAVRASGPRARGDQQGDTCSLHHYIRRCAYAWHRVCIRQLPLHIPECYNQLQRIRLQTE